MEQLALAAEIELQPAGQRVLLNGEDVTAAIRTAEVGQQASVVAAIPGVRRALVEKQRALGARTSVVMEGRDIGTVVFPDADVKIFLDADPGERVQRRLRDFRDRAMRAARETIAAADPRARPARPHPRRSAADAGARRRLHRFHRAFARPGGRGDPEAGAGARYQRKGFQLNDLLVMKFGGTSVGSAERMRMAAAIAAEQTARRPVAIVVSAMSKITDLLLDTMRHAEAGDSAGLEPTSPSCASGTSPPAASCCRRNGTRPPKRDRAT